MVVSMTGYGRAKIKTDTYQLTVEMRSVNHRFFETNIRMPRRMMVYEDKMKKIMKENLKRGRVEVSVTVEGEALQETKLVVHKDLVEQYVESVKQLKKEFLLDGNLEVRDILLLPNITEQIEQEKENPQFLQDLLEVVKEALQQLQEMRVQEGKQLHEDLNNQLSQLKQVIKSIDEYVPKVIERYKERLQNKLAELNGLDEQRFVTEIAIMAERCDIHEEMIRLKSHIQQCYDTLQSEDAIGRKMEFLLQEMHREINTIGAKANDIHISKSVVEMKNNLEKMREQVQNIE